MHVGQAAFDAVVIEAESFVVEADEVQDRGVEIVDRRHVLNRLMTELVGRSV